MRVLRKHRKIRTRPRSTYTAMLESDLWLLGAQLAVVGCLGFLTSRRGPLGSKTFAVRSDWPLAAAFRSANLSGLGCLEHLRKTMPHKAYRVVMRPHRPGGSFDPITRRMYVGQDSYGQCSPRAVLDAAHEFAHVLQVGGAWSLATAARALGVAATVAGMAVSFAPRFRPAVPALEVVVVLLTTSGTILVESHATLAAVELADKYVRQRLPAPILASWDSYIRRQTRRMLLWYEVSNIHFAALLSLLITVTAAVASSMSL